MLEKSKFLLKFAGVTFSKELPDYSRNDILFNLIELQLWEEVFQTKEECYSILKQKEPLPNYMKYDLYSRIFALDTKSIQFNRSNYITTSETQANVLERYLTKKLGININSSVQLLPCLRTTYNINLKSTKRDNLEIYSYIEDIAKLLDYRTLRKRTSNGLLKHTKSIPVNLYVNRTSTGRFSSASPNLQNIEKNKKVRDSFTPTREGHHFAAYDYSQIELRVLAMLSQDQGMIDSFVKGEDLHSNTAIALFGSAEKEKRHIAKSIIFGVVYGGTSQGIASRVGLVHWEVSSYIKKLHRKYPGIKKLTQRCKDRSSTNGGYVYTFACRPRSVNKINTQGLNSVVQGGASEILKIAIMCMIKEGLPKDVHFSLQIHDELIFEAPPYMMDELDDFVTRNMCETVKHYLPAAFRLVPIEISKSHGATLGDLM